MRREEFLELVNGLDGVVRALPLSREQVQEIVDEECSISKVSGGLRMECPGIVACASKDDVFVVFCNESLCDPALMAMEFVDDRGVTIGQSVPQELIPRFKERDDLFWLSDDFVLFSERVGEHDAKLVMNAVRLSDDRWGGMEPWVYFPAPTSYHKLNHMFGNPDQRVSAMVMGVDGLSPSVPVADVVEVPCAGCGHGQPASEDPLYRRGLVGEPL